MIVNIFRTKFGQPIAINNASSAADFVTLRQRNRKIDNETDMQLHPN
jgi:hypothetical protein